MTSVIEGISGTFSTIVVLIVLYQLFGMTGVYVWAFLTFVPFFIILSSMLTVATTKRNQDV